MLAALVRCAPRFRYFLRRHKRCQWVVSRRGLEPRYPIASLQDRAGARRPKHARVALGPGLN